MMAFLAALPAAFKAINGIIDLINRVISMVQKAEFDKWMKDLDDTVKILETPNSGLKEKIAAARALADLTRRM